MAWSQEFPKNVGGCSSFRRPCSFFDGPWRSLDLFVRRARVEAGFEAGLHSFALGSRLRGEEGEVEPELRDAMIISIQGAKRDSDESKSHRCRFGFGRLSEGLFDLKPLDKSTLRWLALTH